MNRISVGAAASFLALSVAVWWGLLDAWDAVAREWFRPNDEWGTTQLRADHVVEGLRPTRILPLLAVFVAMMCVLRRSIRPAVLAGITVFFLVVLTVLAQAAVGRPDTHGAVHRFGGSYPSGHTATIIVCFGLLVLLLRPRPERWLWLVPALAGAVMGGCLLVQAAHWTTDVIGGALLAVVILAAARRFPPSRASGERSDHGSGRSCRPELRGRLRSPRN